MAETTPGTPGRAATDSRALFVAHADADGEWVHGYLLPALGLAAGQVVTPEDFRPGAAVVDEFERSVVTSRFTVVVVTPAFLGDAWSAFGERLASHASAASGRGGVIPLLLEPCEVPLRVDFRVRLDCTDKARWEPEVARLRELLDRPEPPPEVVPCPYPGMRPFGSEDASLFHGREEVVTELAVRLRHQRFLAVVGPSGSGKSSLVMAGVLPELARRHREELVVRVMRPGADPSTALAQALGATGPVDPSGPEGTVAALLAATPAASRLLLVVDQLEEVFTQVGPPAQAVFFEALVALRGVETATVVVTLRADFFGELIASALWPIDPAERLEVAPLRGAALGRAIVRPAAAVGVRVEPALVERLLADAADEPGVLPLLQETMVILWESRDRRLLTLDSYEALGHGGASGLAVALATTADGAVTDLPPPQQAMARRLFLRLVQLGEGRRDTRRQQPVDALRGSADDPVEFDRTLAHLVGRRLMTVSGEEGSARMADLAHEALIAGWPRLQRWIEESRESLRIQREVNGDAEAWVELGRDPGALYRGARLAAAGAWADANRADANALELEFVEAGRAAEVTEVGEGRRQAKTEARSARRLRRVVAGLVVFLALALLAGAVAVQKTGEARGKNRLALSRQLAAQAITETVDRPDRALLASLQALAAESSAEARNALLVSLSTAPALAYLRTDAPVVNAVALTADGSLLATGDRSRKVTLWDVAKRRAVTLGTHDDIVTTVAFSPDGSMLASGGDDGRVRLWDVAGRKPMGEPLGGTVSTLTFSSDGRTLATGSERGVVLWDVAERRAKGEAFGGSRPYVAFSPDGSVLAAAGQDGVLLWDMAAGRPLGQPLAAGTRVQAIAFSTDGANLATASDNQIQIWEVATRRPMLKEPMGGSNPVRDLAFREDGVLAAAYEGGNLFLWEPSTGGWYGEYELGKGNVARGVAFGPDGTTLVSGGTALILWDVDYAKGLARILAEPDPGVDVSNLGGGSRVAFSPDGRTVAAVRGRGAVVVTAVDREDSAEPAAPFPASEAAAVAFSADGRTLVVLHLDGEVSRWDVATRRPTGPRRKLPEPVRGAAFGPGGRYVAVAGGDGRLEVWDTTSGGSLGRPLGGGVVAGAAFSQDGRTLAAVTDDYRIVLWDVEARRAVGQALDARRSARATDEPVSPRLGPAEATPVAELQFSDDGRLLAVVTGDGTVLLFDPSRGTRREVGSGAQPSGIALSPDGRLLFWPVDNGMVAWDVGSGQRLGPPLEIGSAPANVGRFSPAGSRLVQVAADGSVFAFRSDAESWRSLACSMANRNLTKEEWERLMGAGRAYRRTCPQYPSGAGAPRNAPAVKFPS